MSSKSAPFLDRLREMREREAKETSNKLQALQRWQEQLAQLLRLVESWLSQPIQEGLVRLEWSQVQLSDVKYGDYSTHEMRLTFPGQNVVTLTPLGMSGMGTLRACSRPERARSASARWPSALPCSSPG